MPKASKPKKKYVPKPVKVPQTRDWIAELVSDLLGDMAQDLYFTLMALEAHAVSVENWKRISKVLMVVSLATDNLTEIDKADKVAVDSSVLTLKSISDTQVRTGVWRVTDLELASLTAGVRAADRLLPQLPANAVYSAYLVLKQLIALVKE